MKDYLVSIIIPIYNAEEYLDDCINTVRNQTYKDLEIILINDGSTDQSLDICKRHDSEDDRIILIDKKNGGVSAARNIGLDIMSGDYLLLVDSDDYVELNIVERLLDMQREKNADLIMYGEYIHYVLLDKVVISAHEGETFYQKEDIASILPILIEDESLNVPGNKFYKSSIIKDHNIKFDESVSMGEDLIFNYAVANNINSFFMTSECLYHYMKRDGDSLTAKLTPNKYKTLKYVSDYMEKNTEDNEKNSEIIKAIKYIKVKNIYSCLFDLFHKDNKLNYSEKRDYIKNIIRDINLDDYGKFKIAREEILVFILRTKNINLIYIFTYILNIVRKRKTDVISL